MTAKEASILDKLRDELHAYHVDVKQLATRCESCRAEVVQIQTDIYGLPGNKEASPGLMGDVADLRRGRRTLLIGLRCAWAVLLALLGAGATAILRGK